MIRAILYEDNAQYDVLNIYLVRPFICFKLTLTVENHFTPFLPHLTSLNNDYSFRSVVKSGCERLLGR